MITLTYIYHSCFLLTADGICSVLFDYWKETADQPDLRYDLQPDPGFLSTVNSSLPFYVVVSHHHKDHFNPSIFRWQKRFPNIRYILSRDTAKFARHYLQHLKPGSVIVTGHNETYAEGSFAIKGYPSTDIGNAYVVSLNIAGKDLEITAMHAGDLNAWLWLDESTPGEIKDMASRFSRYTDMIAADYPHLDLVMFPVDSRQGRQYWAGASELVHKIKVDRFFPMHFCLGDSPSELEQRRKDACNFREYANKNHGEYIALQTEGSSWGGNPV